MISRRKLFGTPLLAALTVSSAAPGKSSDANCADVTVPDYRLPVASGPFEPTLESLKSYQAPEWFRDAKFGIWSHWGPQAVPRAGDWYARFMYVPGHPHYERHVKAYGHPSKFGYKDIIPLWTAEKFDPEGLMDKYAAAGAEGPTETAGGAFQEKAAYTAEDIRFTTCADVLYAITLGEPKGTVAVTSLGRRAGHAARSVKRVQMLGVARSLSFRHTDDALLIELPSPLPTRHASAFMISFAG